MTENQHQKRAKRKAGVPFHSWLILLLALVCVAGIGSVAAKYTTETAGQGVFHAPEFYFTSNYLSPEGSKYVLNSMVDEITFTLSNGADALRMSEMDITYTVTSTGGSLSSGGGTLYANNAVSSDTIILNDLEPGEDYVVTATGEAGYKQTLTGIFTVAGNDENVYKFWERSKNGYYLLTVWTHNVTGNLNITFPAGLIPDNTDPAMSEVYNLQSDSYIDGSFEVAGFPKYASKTYRFFGDGDNVTIHDFDITVVEGTTTYEAAEKQP